MSIDYVIGADKDILSSCLLQYMCLLLFLNIFVLRLMIVRAFVMMYFCSHGDNIIIRVVIQTMF